MYPAMPDLKRSHDEDTRNAMTAPRRQKKQKSLSTFEQCKERTNQLQVAMTQLDNFLIAKSLVDNSARRDMSILSMICADILQDEDDSEPRAQEYADTLNDPLDVPADDALAGLSPSALEILTNNGRRTNPLI